MAKQSELDYKNFVIDSLDISFGKVTLLKNTKLIIQYGQHYGIIGKNGIGKTTLLNWIYERKLPIPMELDMIYVKQEETEFENTVMDTILSSNITLYNQNKRLIELEELLIDSNVTKEIFNEYEELSKLVGQEFCQAKAFAKKILAGLGFTLEQMDYQVSQFSGGWKMRVTLAKAIFMTPTLLILDEPTNHLDLHANIWLTEYLKTYPKTILLVSHDKFFIDEVCTNIIHIDKQKLKYYDGNYDKFQKQVSQCRIKHEKDWKLFQKKIETMRKTNKSKSEIDIFIKKNNVIKPEKEYQVKISFLQPSIIKGNLLTLENVSCGYTNNILQGININISMGSRIAIVGRNGVGKSTLVKLIADKIKQTCGYIYKSSQLKIGYYDQHFEQSLPFDINGIQYLMSLNQDLDLTNSHKYLSLFGLDAINHNTLIGQLSGGQKARVKLASFGIIKPQLLLLDEPTNHLDIVAINSLIHALKHFEGGLILITHNFDLIQELDCQLWVVDNGEIFQYNGTHQDYIQEVYNETEIK